MVLGMTPGSTSRKSGWTLSSFSTPESAMESITNTRSTVYRCSSRARRMKLGRVEMMPSVWVALCRKSTAISLEPDSPVTRSACTMASLPACLTRATMSPMEQMSPNSRNTTWMVSVARHCSSPSMFFTAAMTGEAATAS